MLLKPKPHTETCPKLLILNSLLSFFSLKRTGIFSSPSLNVPIFIPLILLFGNLKDPIIIFGILPLSFIGILPGLFITGRTFGFMAIIGTISLSGMMIKSAIVLIDEIRYEIYTLKKEPFKAIIDSSASRIRAVSLAAGTTVLGMIPLMFDPLFSDMAITIVFGLTITTMLILFVVPLLYSIFYKVNKPKEI